MKKMILFCLVLALSFVLIACSGGQPQETEHQHTYVQGVCSGCQEKQPDYVPLMSSIWVAMGVAPEGETLDVVSLCFYEWGNRVETCTYDPLESFDKEQQDYYLQNEPGNILEFEGKKYYNAGLSAEYKMKITEQGNTVEIRIENGMTVGTFKMERTAANQYTVVETAGLIVNSTVNGWLKPGAVFTAE